MMTTSHEAADAAPAPLVRIVDDDRELLRSAAFLIRMAGFDVRTYESAALFLSEDDPLRPGCILLDQRMPGMTGLELQEALVERGDSAPIIFLSAHGDIPMAMQAVHRGAMDFLVKPADPEVLIAAVKKAVEKSLADAKAAGEESRIMELTKTLTERELQVAQLVAQGLLNKQIADRLGITLPTVKMHRGNVTRKLGLKSAVAIAKALERAGLLAEEAGR